MSSDLLDPESWHKARASGGSTGNCVEVCGGRDGHRVIGVRDTKNRGGGTLMFDHQTWDEFIRAVKAGTHDR
jgi:uncharacterized protein DUF397